MRVALLSYGTRLAAIAPTNESMEASPGIEPGCKDLQSSA